MTLNLKVLEDVAGPGCRFPEPCKAVYRILLLCSFVSQFSFYCCGGKVGIVKDKVCLCSSKACVTAFTHLNQVFLRLTTEWFFKTVFSRK